MSTKNPLPFEYPALDDLERRSLSPPVAGLEACLVTPKGCHNGVAPVPRGIRPAEEAFLIAPAGDRGVVMIRAFHYPLAWERIEEVCAVPPPAAIEPAEVDAYTARLAALLKERAWDLPLSVLALGSTGRGVAGWVCGSVAVWRVDKGCHPVSPSQLLDAPPELNLPKSLVKSGIISTSGVCGGDWFEADGERFAMAAACPLPSLDVDPPEGLGGMAARVAEAAHGGAGLAGWWTLRGDR